METKRNKAPKNPALTDKIEKDKAAKKPEVNFQISLNEEQKEGKRVVLNESDITILLGGAGSGKTLLACQIALDRLFKKECKRIVIARPAVEAGENLGFLPGDLKDKMDNYLQPIYDNMYQLYKKEQIDKYLAEGVIQIIPFAYMRGRTFTDAFIILDEIQNCSQKQIELALGRLGKGSKMVLCGDEVQSDLKGSNKTGMRLLKHLSEKIDRIKTVVLKANHRHDIVTSILKECEDYNQELEIKKERENRKVIIKEEL